VNSNLIDLNGRRSRERDRSEFHHARWPYDRRPGVGWKVLAWGLTALAIWAFVCLMFACEDPPQPRTPLAQQCYEKCHPMGMQPVIVTTDVDPEPSCECLPIPNAGASK
jgi:hypothetical protein